MPTYLTPGVYVEEVPSTSKPIEGVGTSVAAFVGLAPGGPINTPMRIANWTQFAKVFGDPSEPENGPFMEGAYLAHSVYGFFQNGGALCWVIRIGNEDGAARPMAALPAAADRTVETFRAEALPGVDGPVQIQLSEEPATSTGGDGKEAEPTYKLVVDGASGGREEHEGLSIKKGRNNIATKVNAASKLIRIEETGASLPDAQRAPRQAPTTCPRLPPTSGRSTPVTSRGTSPAARGWARWRPSTRSPWSASPTS
jgi:hypothetical protein